MNTCKINDKRGEINNLVDDANFYHTSDPAKSLDLLDEAKEKLNMMYRLIWETTYTSGKPTSS